MAWVDVAISDMRIPGFAGAYLDSYASHDSPWLGRNYEGPSGQYDKAGLNQGRYMRAAECFSATNPDFAAISYDVGSVRAQNDIYRLMPWMQTCFGESFGTGHLPGYTGNSRILMWDVRVSVKSKSSGLWTDYGPFEFFEGMVLTASSRGTAIGPGDGDHRIEPAYSNHYSCRSTVTPAAVNSGYYTWHGWTNQQVAVDPGDVADIIGSCRTSVILHNDQLTDDRQFYREMFTFAIDAYPAAGTPPYDYYQSVGWGRAKYVTARWPESQLHVIHTMTEAQFNAAGGYPATFPGYYDDAGGGGGGNSGGPPVVAPTRSRWFPKLVTARNAWNQHAVSNTVADKPRRRRRLSIWS